MDAPSDAIAQPPESRETARGAITATALLLLVMVLTAISPVRLALVELNPVQALIEGIRLPGGLPHLGLPFGQHAVTTYWLAETLGALTLLAVFWVRCRSARNGEVARGRLRIFGQVWLDTVLATLIGCLVAAVVGSFFTHDLVLPYLLLIGGTVLFALVIGAVVGLLAGLVAAAAREVMGSAQSSVQTP